MYIIIYILFLVNFKRFRIIYIFLIIYISIILYNLYYHCNSHHHNKIDYFLYNNINIYAIYIYMRWNFFGFDNNLLDIHIYIYISLYIIIFLQYYFFFYLINCFCGIYVNEYYFQIGFCFFALLLLSLLSSYSLYCFIWKYHIYIYYINNQMRNSIIFNILIGIIIIFFFSYFTNCMVMIIITFFHMMNNRLIDFFILFVFSSFSFYTKNNRYI